MAMTLRLDQETSAQLRALSQQTGRSQQQLVHEAVGEYVGKTLAATDERRREWRECLRRARICRPTPAPGTPDPWLEPPSPSAQRDPEYQAMIDSGLITPARSPFVDVIPFLPSPPGGVMALLDREDRF